MSPPSFNGEFTRVLGSIGDLDFHSGTWSFREKLKETDQTIGIAARTPHRDVAAQKAVLAGPLIKEAVYCKRAVTLTEVLSKWKPTISSSCQLSDF
jgi:hypothetical protein